MEGDNSLLYYEITMGYKFRDDLATADIAFEAWGSSWSELFQEAGLATEAVMIELSTINLSIKHEFNLKELTIDRLLFRFLDELIYIKDVHGLLFGRFVIEIKEQGDEYLLQGCAEGERLDVKRHTLHMDVKAVTYHMFEVRKRGDKDYFARVILDI